jgi:hypothetical protein
MMEEQYEFALEDTCIQTNGQLYVRYGKEKDYKKTDAFKPSKSAAPNDHEDGQEY